jgi:glucosamine-6-phosphate deaminase
VFSKGTHCVNLTEFHHQGKLRLFESEDQVPRQAYTMGVQTIMRARSILVVANGPKKAQAVYDMIYGPVTPKVPASILQLHTNCTVVADEEALALCPEGVGKGSHSQRRMPPERVAPEAFSVSWQIFYSSTTWMPFG